MKVWVAQLLCPNHHTVMALAGEIEDEQIHLLGEVLRQGFERMVETGKMNPHCGLCKSTQLYIEVSRTEYDSAVEAVPEFEETQRKQLITEQLKRSRN